MPPAATAHHGRWCGRWPCFMCDRTTDPDRLAQRFPIDVRLSGAEVMHARYLGMLRHAEDTREGLHDRKADPNRSSVLVSVDGMVGEAAGARALGQQPDMNTDPEPPFGHDLTLPSGVTVDIKTIQKAGYGLILNHKPGRPRERYSDLFVLVRRLSHYDYRLLGWTYRDTLINKRRLRYDLPSPAYLLPQSELFTAQLPDRWA